MKGKMTGNWNKNGRRSGGDRKFVIHGRICGTQDFKSLMFFSRLERLAKEIDIPYIEVLKKAREDGFFDADDETIEEIARIK